MQTALHLTARVQAGNRIEILAPELTVGDAVEVFVVLPNTVPSDSSVRGSVMDMVAALPAGPRSGSSWEAIENALQEERDAWDH